jgi:imidazoleglycerol-phosphate dehydratase/histidinol-phosphatase
MKKTLFIDRDGCLIEEPGAFNPKNPRDENWVPYQVDTLEKLSFMTGVFESLQKLKNAGYKLVLISNQDGRGTSVFPEEAFMKVHEEMMKEFKEKGIEFDREFICPHFLEDDCLCRKPKISPELKKYLESEDINWSQSFLIGDRESDLQLAKNMGCKAIQISSRKPWPLIAKEILTS